MDQKILELADTRIEAFNTQNILYLRVFGVYTEHAMVELSKFIDTKIQSIEGHSIRIWDFSYLPSENFQLSGEATKKMAQWAASHQDKQCTVYVIAPAPVCYGVARMYQVLTADYQYVEVFKNFDELPEEIRKKLMTMYSDNL